MRKTIKELCVRAVEDPSPGDRDWLYAVVDYLMVECDICPESVAEITNLSVDQVDALIDNRYMGAPIW